MIDDISTILPIALALSADSFAVSISCSVSIGSPSKLQIIRQATAFGSFHALMTFLGWLAGNRIWVIISGFDHWLSFGMLVFVGSRMIWESIHSNNRTNAGLRYDKTTSLLILSVASSLDALAVGFGLSFLNVSIALSSTVIGITAFGITILGLLLGTRFGKLAGQCAHTAGGAILIAIGTRILISHIL